MPLALCAANNGDVIVLVQNHAETIGTVALDKAGITVIGLGIGTDMPTITFDGASDEIAISAANVVVSGVRCIAGIAEVANAFDMQAGSDYSVVINCEFPEPGTATFEFDKVFQMVTGADNVTIAYNTWINQAATPGATCFIDGGAAAIDSLSIIGNYINADADVAALYSSDQADTNLLIENNTVIQEDIDQFNLELTGAATGFIKDNTWENLGGSSFYMDPGTCAVEGNTGDSPTTIGREVSAFYVDSANGSNNNTGKSWSQAVATITYGLTLMSDHSSLYVGGVAYTESCTLPAGIERGKIIGVSNSGQIPFWQSAAAGTPHLIMSSGEWEVSGFRFYGTVSTTSYVQITATGAAAVIKDNWFSGNGAACNGIDFAGPPTDVRIIHNRFTGFEGSGGAIYGSDYGIQAVLMCEIFDNFFGDNTINIRILGRSNHIKGNVFSTSTTGPAVTTYICTNDLAAPGGAGGGNIVTGNYFPDPSYLIDAANGYFSSTYDSWIGNYCPDGLSTEARPKLGTSVAEFKSAGSPTFLCSEVTSAMTSANGYDASDDPVIFTVTGSILCRAHAVTITAVTSTSSDTVELGIAGQTAILLVQDVVDGAAFQVGDVWSMTTGADDDGCLALPTEWYFIGGGADILLSIDNHTLTAGKLRFNLEWKPMSADANVVGAAP